MTTIRLLANVANDPKGAVIHVEDRRAQRLIQTGYAERAPETPKKLKKKES